MNYGGMIYMRLRLPIKHAGDPALLNSFPGLLLRLTLKCKLVTGIYLFPRDIDGIA